MNTFLEIPSYLLHGTIKDESRYRHFSPFSVIAIGNNSLRLSLSLSMVLNPGQQINIKILGMVLVAEVQRWNENLQWLEIDVEFIKRLRWELSHILIQHTEFTPLELTGIGLSCRKLKSYLDYSLIRTDEEYQQVLKLRRQTYSQANKMEADRPLEKLKYFFDEYSDVLIVRHGNKIIGSAAIIYGDGKDKMFEVQKLMLNNSDKLEYNDSMIEVAALCILKEYRKTDILHGVFENIFFYMMKNKKDYIIASSDSKLAKTYKMIGFKDTGDYFFQPKYNDLAMQVLIVNKNAALKAHGIGFLHWWPIWGEIVTYMKSQSMVKMGLYNRAKLFVREVAYKTMKFFIASS